MSNPQFEQLPALFVGAHNDPLKMEIVGFSPQDLERFWPLTADVARTFPHVEFRDPLTETQPVVPGMYSSPQAMVNTLDIAGFAQGGLFLTTHDRRNQLVGHVGLHTADPLAAEMKVHIFEPKARSLAEVALSAVVRVAAYAQEHLGIAAVQADIMDTDTTILKAYASVGFTHIPQPKDYDTIACGPSGEEYSHLQTWELRQPDSMPPGLPNTVQSALIDGWQKYQNVRKFVIW